MGTPNTIVLKGDPIKKEGVASEAIKPGRLIEFGGSADLQNHDDADQNARKAFAVERDMVGDGIDTDYDEDDTVVYVVGRSGDEVLARAAASLDASKGAPLTSNGDGRLKAWAAQSDSGDGSAEIQNNTIVGYLLEDVTSATADDPIRVEVA